MISIIILKETATISLHVERENNPLGVKPLWIKGSLIILIHIKDIKQLKKKKG